VAVAGSTVLGHQLGLSTGKSSTATAKRLVIADPYAAGGNWFKGNLHVASVRGVGKDLGSSGRDRDLGPAAILQESCLRLCRHTGTTITVEAAPGSSLHFSGRDGHVLKAVAASTGSYQVRGDEGLRPRGSDQGKHRLAVRLRP